VGASGAAAYRNLRRAQHRARLDEEPTAFEPALFAAERAAIGAVWLAVFGA
jgi:glutamate-ammonia-ligase adenylyltransferase